ncbi:MAG: DUF3806 domain-containing protein [Betaproteobacteria bacterium]
MNPLTDAEAAWIQEQLRAASQFLADYGSTRSGEGLDALDHAWAAWLDRQSVDPGDTDPVINAVGVYLGQALVDAMGDFHWVNATDDSGTALAVQGLPGSADLLVYPADVVARQYAQRTQYFLRIAFDEIVNHAAQLRT